MIADVRRDQRGGFAAGADGEEGLGGQGRGTELHHTVGLYEATTGHALQRAIQRDHNGRGWADYFYNAMVLRDGTVFEDRQWNRASGTEGHFTIVLPGNHESRQLTKEQCDSVVRLRGWLMKQGVGNGVHWHGQRAAANRHRRSSHSHTDSRPAPSSGSHQPYSQPFSPIRLLSGISPYLSATAASSAHLWRWLKTRRTPVIHTLDRREAT